MWKQIQKKTLFFLGFMMGFLIVLLFLTYYSHVAYLKNLPLVVTRMPERTEEYKNGRYLYRIPEQAVQKEEDSGKFFLYTARNHRDILGERNLVTKILIRVEKTVDGTMVLVDGIVREEPIVTEEMDLLYEGQSVLLKKPVTKR